MKLIYHLLGFVLGFIISALFIFSVLFMIKVIPHGGI